MTDKILIDRAVVEQALMYLGDEAPLCSGCVYEWAQAIKVLRAALEQPQVEQETKSYKVTGKTGEFCVFHSTEVKRGDMVYTHPQPPRQPLTEQQINDHRLALAYDSEDLPDPWDFKQGVRAAERAHGIKEQK